MSKLRMGVLSPARIAVEKVLPALARAQRCEVVAIASREPARARKAAEALGIPRVHESYAALLADPDVDAVYIPLPNHLHAEWTISAARAGKHVLCEKPLAMTVDEAKEMVGACRQAGVVFMEAYMYRFHPQWVRVRDLVTSGRIGSLRTVQTFFAYRNVDPDNIRNIAAFGGGALMDIGCYPIDMSRMLFGAEPSRVCGAMHTDPEFDDVDVLTSGLLEFPDGGQSTFTCATKSEPGQWVNVIGSEGRVTVHRPVNAQPEASMRLTLTTTEAGAQDIDLPAADQYTLQGDAFASAVLDGSDVPIAPEEGIADLEVIERLRASANAG